MPYNWKNSTEKKSFIEIKSTFINTFPLIFRTSKCNSTVCKHDEKNNNYKIKLKAVQHMRKM